MFFHISYGMLESPTAFLLESLLMVFVNSSVEIGYVTESYVFGLIYDFVSYSADQLGNCVMSAEVTIWVQFSYVCFISFFISIASVMIGRSGLWWSLILSVIILFFCFSKTFV